MNFKNSVLSLVAAFVAAISFTACNTSTGNGDNIDYSKVFTDIVTVKEASTAGCVFTFQKEDDSPMITLTTTQAPNLEAVKPGMRIAAMYAPESGEHYVSGPITVLQAVAAIGEGKAMQIADNDFGTNNVNKAEFWRSGDYLNGVVLVYGANPSKLELVVDRNTLSTSYPVVHLIYRSGSNTGMQPYAYYMSYNLADLFAAEGVENAVGVRVVYSADGGPGEANISRPGQAPIRPAE